jgi:3-hydroxyisobutyrate dehydrogenase
MRIGFIGLGAMGSGMAANLARSHEDVFVFDVDADRVAALVSVGATAATGVPQIASQCDVVLTSLPGPAQVEEVVFGDHGILANMREGLVLFDLSTSSVSMARRVEQAFAQHGGAMLDMPVSGGPAGAASGDLTLWIGGSREVYDTHVELLRAFSTHPQYVGPIGAGTITKLAHNLVGYMMMESLAEVFSMSVKAGLDPLDLWEAMRFGLVGRGSPLDMLVKQFLPGSYETPAFALDLAHKDVTLATALGRELGVPMRLANMTLAEMTEALGRGYGRMDSRSFLRLQLERAGVEIKVDPDRISAAVERASRPS